jgi:hypothetical protein
VEVRDRRLIFGGLPLPEVGEHVGQLRLVLRDEGEHPLLPGDTILGG